MTGKDVIEKIIVDLEKLQGGIMDMEEMKEVIEEMKQYLKEEENMKKKDEMNTTTTPGIQLEEDNMIIENDSSSIQYCSHHKFSPLCFRALKRYDMYFTLLLLFCPYFFKKTLNPFICATIIL